MWGSIVSALKGTPQARAMHRHAMRGQPGVASGVAALELARRAGPAAAADALDDEAPIFLLSAGWRAGSTMLQRLLMSDRRVLIWGEPYDECGLLQHLAQACVPFRPGWPREDYLYDGRPFNDLSGEWIANLFPGLDTWRAAHRALLQTLLADPARRAGATRWGVKEVRLTVEHARYLRWLYPKAQFVLLVRDPMEAYRSYCSFGRNWYDTWPDRPVFTPQAFGRHWSELAEGFLRAAEALGAVLVRYEDMLKGPQEIDRLEAGLGLRLDRATLGKKVRNSGQSAANPSAERPAVNVSRVEAWLLRREVRDTAARLGYEL